MRVLIVESNLGLCDIWARHLRRHGLETQCAGTVEEAFSLLRTDVFEVVILNIMLSGINALAVSDYASVVQPKAQVILVTNSGFFSDGSIFQVCTTARAFVGADTAPEDLAAMAEHFAHAPRDQSAPHPVGLPKAPAEFTGT